MIKCSVRTSADWMLQDRQILERSCHQCDPLWDILSHAEPAESLNIGHFPRQNIVSQKTLLLYSLHQSWSGLTDCRILFICRYPECDQIFKQNLDRYLPCNYRNHLEIFEVMENHHSCWLSMIWHFAIHSTEVNQPFNIRVCNYVGWHLPHNNFLQFYVHIQQWHVFLLHVSVEMLLTLIKLLVLKTMTK